MVCPVCVFTNPRGLPGKMRRTLQGICIQISSSGGPVTDHSGSLVP